nr:Root meristem growth factor 6 [Ipomoea batatas]GMD75060.1 Root meristem growth factor 6 [Ipomoea batatas]
MPFLVYLLLFLSLHACTSRPLGINHTHHYLLHLSHKAVKLPIKEEFHMAENFQAKNEQVLQEKLNFGESKSQARSTLESPETHNTEETVKSNEDEPVEDVVVMDYAQPHRKTPIHNKAP